MFRLIFTDAHGNEDSALVPPTDILSDLIEVVEFMGRNGAMGERYELHQDGHTGAIGRWEAGTWTTHPTEATP